MKSDCESSDHYWRFNFSTIPNKAICGRCHIKSTLDLRTLEWESVDEFEGEKRTDKELSKTWVYVKGNY